MIIMSNEGRILKLFLNDEKNTILFYIISIRIVAMYHEKIKIQKVIDNVKNY